MRFALLMALAAGAAAPGQPIAPGWPSAPGQPAQERLVQDRLAPGQPAQERLAQDRLAPGQPAQERLAQERLAQDRLAPGQPAQDRPDPRIQAAVRKVQTWVDTVEGRLAEIVQASTVNPPEVLSEPGGGRRLVFRVTVQFKRDFYDRFGQWQQEWPEAMDPQAQRRVGGFLSRLNRYGIYLGLYNADGDLVAKAPVVRNPYFANTLEDYYENREGDLVPVPHTQTFRDRPENVEAMLRRGDLAFLASPSVFQAFRPVFQAEWSTRKEVVVSVAAEDLTSARVYRLVMEASGR